MLSNYICALDIGSSKIAAVVAQIKRGHIANLFFENIPAKGVKRGMIVDSHEVANCAGYALKNLKAKSGINIKYIHTALCGQDIITKHSHAIIPLTEHGNKVITPSDIRAVNEQARILGMNLEEECIHQIPCGYSTDSKSNIPNPLGLYSHRLEVDLCLVCGKLSSIQTLTRAINQTGYEIKDLFFSGIATSRVLFNEGLKAGVNIVCDIGAEVTQLMIFNEGILTDITILPFGGNDLTQQLSESLKIPLDLAEEVKRSYALVGGYPDIKEDKEILLKKSSVYTPIKQKLVAEIATLKAKEFSRNIKEAIEKVSPCTKVNNVVAAGRAILLEGFLEHLEHALGISVRLGRISDPDIASLVPRYDNLSGTKYLTYLTSLGIICQALYGQHPQTLIPHQPSRNPVSNIINKVKEVYQEYF
jgi:cell division protein FtsA